jgi:hypothetical protein
MHTVFLCGKLLEISNLENQRGDRAYEIKMYAMETGCEVWKWTDVADPKYYALMSFGIRNFRVVAPEI